MSQPSKGVKTPVTKKGEAAEPKLDVAPAPKGDPISKRGDPSNRTLPSVVNASPAPLEQLGDTDRYEVLDSIGEGGVGEVLVAKDGRLRREVALKRLHPDHAAEPEVRARFEREGRIQAQLEHPNIVPVYDMALTADGESCFTMKRIRGLTLREVLQSLRKGETKASQLFTLHKLLAVFNSLCLTLEYAHSRGVIHRDLKPENIMLGQFGEINVLDWGLAKVADDPEPEPGEHAEVLEGPTPKTVDVDDPNVSPTVDGAILGTPGYMPPEQINGDHHKLTPASDVYALGAILFEILTLDRLFTQKSGQGRMIAALAEPHVDARPSTRAPEREIAPELEHICVVATAFEPEQRYQSARELHDEVQAFLEGDRDLERRTRMAIEHTTAAERALSEANAGVDDVEQARTVAARELRTALALDPDNQTAQAAILNMLVTLPERLPEQVREELVAARGKDLPKQGKLLALATLMVALFVPFGLWMGVKSWTVVGAFGGFYAAYVVLGYAWALGTRPTLFGPVLVAMTGYVALATTFLGPLFFVPAVGINIVLMLTLHLRATLRQRVMICALVAGGFMVPFVLQTVGILPPAYLFENGMLLIKPTMLQFPQVATLVTLALATGANFLAPVLVMGRWVDALSGAERERCLREWQLRQFAPEAAQSMVADGVISRPA